MSAPRPWGRFPLVVLALVGFFGAQLLLRDTYVFAQVLTTRTVAPFAHLLKIAAQAAGCVYAARCAAYYEKGSPVRAPWLLVSVWLGAYVPAQAILAVYECVLHRAPPVPSIADPFALVGNVCVVVALVRFLSAYRRSGFPMGQLRDDLLVVAAACVALAAVAYRPVAPIALGDGTLAAKAVKLGYLALDCVQLALTVVLLRMTARFRGGRVWVVWAALLAGIVFAAGGDVLFADVSEENVARWGPGIDLAYVLSYVFCAYGGRKQWALLTD